MNPAELVRRASADGVSLKVTPTGTLKVTGDDKAVRRWLPTLKANKPELVAALTQLPADLARRIQAMARRWCYTDAELAEVMVLATHDPGTWLRAVSTDEQRETEFRAHGMLPKN